MTDAVQIPENPEIQAAARSWRDLAADFAVETQADADYAGAALPKLRVLQDRVRDFCKPAIDAARESKRTAEAALSEVKRLEEQMLEPFVAVERRLKGMIGAWVTKQEQERQRAIDEQARQEREARAERERQERAQRELEEQARKANLPPPVPLPPSKPLPTREELKLPPPPAPIAGTQVRKVRTATVVDKMALLRAIVDGKVSHELVDVDHAKLVKLAGVLSEPPPGVEFGEDTEIAHEARRGKRR